MSGVFVGRGRELDLLRAGAERAATGEPAFVLVEGSAGYGKTSLLATFKAELRDWRQVGASAAEEESRLPFGLVTRMVAGADLDGAALSRADPFRVGAELLHVLGDLQETAPVALVVDDVHWADAPSLLALTFALRRLQADRVLTVLTMRPDDAPRVPSALLRMADERGVRVRLAGLTHADVRELAVALGHPGLSAPAAQRLVTHTGGSPLHLGALLAETPLQELRRTRGRLPSSQSFTALVRGVLDTCSGPGRALLQAAAVLGNATPLARAAAVGAVRPDAVAVLEEVAGTHLVDAVRDTGSWDPGGWTVTFRHPVIRAAVLEDLGPATVGTLHARAAEVTTGGTALLHRAAGTASTDAALASVVVAHADGEVRAGRLGAAADLLLAAGRLTPAGPGRDERVLRAVDLLLAAGEAAEALRHLDRLRAMPDTALRQLVLARLESIAGRPEAAAQHAKGAWERGSGPTRAAAAAMLAQLAMLGLGGAEAATWAQRALADGPPSSVATIVRGTRAVGLALTGHVAEGLQVLAHLPENPAAVPAEQIDELAARGLVRMWTDDLAAAYTDLRPFGLGPAWEPRPYGLVGLGDLAEIEYRLGFWDDALLHAGQVVSLVIDTEQRWLTAFAHVAAVPVLAGRGMWREARENVEAATAAATAIGDAASTAYAANAAVTLAACRGEPAAVLAAAAPMSGLRHGSEHEPGLFTWAEHHASALVALGRLEDAEREIDALDDRARLGGRSSVLAAAAALRAELAVARRDPATARAAYEQSLELGAGCAAVLDRARRRAALGRLLRRTGRRRAAIEQLGAAREEFDRLRARPFLERCEAELAACGVAVTASTGPHDELLSPQERAVAQLVRTGHTNREVAAALVLSVKTVGYHLGNVYAKLGVSSRTQLAARWGPAGAEPGHSPEAPRRTTHLPSPHGPSPTGLAGSGGPDVQQQHGHQHRRHVDGRPR